MSESKKKALETLNKIKELYELDDSGILTADFYYEFMDAINEQINEIERCYK